MKTTITTIICILFSIGLFAQAPLGISHQAVIRDAQGKLVSSKTIGIRVSILQGSDGGTAVYVETHECVSNTNGLVTYVIGKGTPALEIEFAEIDWADGPYFLKTEVDPEGGTSYSIEGTVQFQSVPYALHAQDAATEAYVDQLKAKILAMGEALGFQGTFTDDRDGNTYTWVKIGDQVWMAENLKYLPSVVGPATGSETEPYYYVYDYDGTDLNDAIATASYQNYGVLYNWPAAMNSASSSQANPSGVQGACPVDWHLPSDEEWSQLVTYLGTQGYTYSDVITTTNGYAIKSCRQVNSPLGGDCNTIDHPRWDADSTIFAADVFGFSALPGGYRRLSNGSFYRKGYIGLWWSSFEENPPSEARYYHIPITISGVNWYYINKALGFSVRCVRD